MRERYEAPEMEIVEFDVEDVITASNGSGNYNPGNGGSEDNVF